MPTRSGAARAAVVAHTISTGDKVGSTEAAEHSGWHASLVVLRRILSRDRRRDAVAELRGVGELVHTSDRAAAADETVEVVAGIVGPGRAELRDGLTHREAGELDVGIVHAERTAGDCAVGWRSADATAGRHGADRRQEPGRPSRQDLPVAAVAAGRSRRRSHRSRCEPRRIRSRCAYRC